MADIFNRTTDSFGGAFSADSSVLNFAGSTGDLGDLREAGLLVQNLQIQYRQQVTRLYEVGSAKMYYVGGRTEGQGNMGRVLGPVGLSTAFLSAYGNVCAAKNVLKFSLKVGCDNGQDVAWRDSNESFVCRFVVITSVGLAVAAQDMLVNSDVQFMFSYFNLNN
jgi:hypothetical protein